MGLVMLLFAVPIIVAPLFAIEAAWRLISQNLATLRSLLVAMAAFIAATLIGVFAPLLSHFGDSQNFIGFIFEVIQLAIACFALGAGARFQGKDSGDMLGVATGLFFAAVVFPAIYLGFGNQLLLRFGISLHS